MKISDFIVAVTPYLVYYSRLYLMYYTFIKYSLYPMYNYKKPNKSFKVCMKLYTSCGFYYSILILYKVFSLTELLGFSATVIVIDIDIIVKLNVNAILCCRRSGPMVGS